MKSSTGHSFSVRELPESVPSLINNAAIAITTILGYSAMGGAIGAGGLGKLIITG